MVITTRLSGLCLTAEVFGEYVMRWHSQLLLRAERKQLTHIGYLLLIMHTAGSALLLHVCKVLGDSGLEYGAGGHVKRGVEKMAC